MQVDAVVFYATMSPVHARLVGVCWILSGVRADAAVRQPPLPGDVPRGGVPAVPTGVRRQLRLRLRDLPPALRLGGAGRAAAVRRALPRDAYLPPRPKAATAQVPSVMTLCHQAEPC